MIDDTLDRCPGLYCGRTEDAYGNLSDCGACARGFRVDSATICRPCTEMPTFYDMLYLGFMALLVPCLNCFFIDYTNSRKSPWLLLLYASTMLECTVSMLCTLVMTEPVGKLEIEACPVESIRDWYTMFYNPSPDYINTVYCTQEAVYPLYTMVMVYYACCLVTMMLIRPALSAYLVSYKGTGCIYAALYFLPILVVTHALLAGVIYYAFPYILLVATVITNAIHFSFFTKQDIKSLVVENATSVRNVMIIIAHWLLLAYCVVSITEMRDPAVHGPLLLLVPCPALFYVLTVKFTDPSRLEAV